MMSECSGGFMYSFAQKKQGIHQESHPQELSRIKIANGDENIMAKNRKK
jgi:hypothetical protein